MCLFWLMIIILYCRFFDCKVDIVYIYLLVVGCDVVFVVVCVVGFVDVVVFEKIKNSVNYSKKMLVLKLIINILLLLLIFIRYFKYFYNIVKIVKWFEKSYLFLYGIG